MSIASIFIRRPRLAFVVSAIMVIAGVLALGSLPVAQFPNIVPPEVTVTTNYAGASAEVVEESVAQIIERNVNGVENMISMKSTSGSDGSYSLSVYFKVGSNPQDHTVKVNNRINRAMPQLPDEVQRNGVLVKKQSSALLQVVAVYSPKGSRDALFLSNFATINVLDPMQRVPGVGSAGLFGGLDYAMRVWLDLDRMSSLGITSQDVVKAIEAKNMQAAVGRVGAAPLLDGVDFQLNITAKGRLTSAEEFGNISVRATPNGALLRIRDIGRVELGSANADVTTRYNGKPAAGIQIYQLAGANALATAEGVRQVLKELQDRLPDDVAFDVMYDTTVFVEATIESVIHTLIEAFVLVAIVVFLFLGSLRATLIPIIAVPVALVGTFAVMQVLGLSLNTVSLLALVLAIGIVVDDAIVVVEAVEHKLETEPGLTPAEATEKAMTEVTGPIVAITLVLLSVFVPTAFMPGIAGKLYQQFAVTISVAMVISAINALSLSPALCALLLTHRAAPRGLMARLQRGIDATRHGYLRLAGPLIRRSVLAVGLVFLFALATGGLARLVPTGFLPEEDQSSFMAEIQLPDAASTSRTLEAVMQVESMLTGQPWLQNFFTVSGNSLLDGLNLPNRAMMIISLKPYADRRQHDMSAFAVLERLNKAFQRVAVANVYAFNPPPIAGLGNSSGFEFEIQSLTGARPEEIVAVARGVLNAAQSAPELAGVFTTYSASTPQIRLELDRDRAETLGVEIPDIFSALQTAMGSRNVNNFNMFGRTWTVRVQADALDRRTIEDVNRVRVRSTSGKLVPLQAVATLELTTAPATIVRYNNLRAVTLNGAPAPGYSSGEAITAMERVARANLPPGYAFQWAGTAQQEKEAGSQTGFVLALAVLFAYLFLVGLYESLALPVAALLSVIVGLFGALAALWLTGLANNVYAQIGIVVLIALAAKNAILVIEVAMQERARGSDPVTAATTAAGQRFRAVMMTSFAFILGLVPMVIASGAGAATQRAVGTAVFGGMVAAACLGIFVIPGLYVAFEKMRTGVPGLLRRPFLKSKTPDSGGS